MTGGFYHQDERDSAVAIGCLSIVAILALVIGLVSVILLEID